MGLKGLFFLVRGARTGAFEMGEEGRFTGDGGIVRLLFLRNVGRKFCLFVFSVVLEKSETKRNLSNDNSLIEGCLNFSRCMFLFECVFL